MKCIKSTSNVSSSSDVHRLELRPRRRDRVVIIAFWTILVLVPFETGRTSTFVTSFPPVVVPGRDIAHQRCCRHIPTHTTRKASRKISTTNNISSQNEIIQLDKELPSPPLSSSVYNNFEFTSHTDDDAFVSLPDTVWTNHPPTLDTWRRRLITKEDKFHLHKISGICFLISSTTIMIGGFSTGFSAIPTWLGSFTRILVWSGWFQLYTSVVMTRKYRSRLDEKAAFLVTSIGSSMTNLLALWFSPFCPNLFLHHAWIPHCIIAANTLYLWLPVWTFMAHPRQTIQFRQGMNHSGRTPSYNQLFRLPRYLTSNLCDGFAYFVQVPMINLVASRMLWLLHRRGRDFFLTSWILKGTPAQNMANIFYSMVFLTMASNYVALMATLRDKHLITQKTESWIMTLLGAISVLLILKPF